MQPWWWPFGGWRSSALDARHRCRRLEAEVERLVVTFTEFRHRVEQMGVAPEAVEAFGKLAQPSAGMDINIVTSTAFGPTIGAWPKRVYSGDKISVTATLTFQCGGCGMASTATQHTFVMEVL